MPSNASPLMHESIEKCWTATAHRSSRFLTHIVFSFLRALKNAARSFADSCRWVIKGQPLLVIDDASSGALATIRVLSRVSSPLSYDEVVICFAGDVGSTAQIHGHQEVKRLNLEASQHQ